MSRVAPRSLTGTLVALTAALVLTACHGSTSRGTLYTIKMDRELAGHLPSDHVTAHDDAIALLQDEYHFHVYYEALDAREGIIEAVTAKERRVRVETYYVDEDLTRIEVYVTPLGDQRLQHEIFERLETLVASESVAAY